MADPKRVYSDEQVKSILSRAIEHQRRSGPDKLSHDDLLSIAKDAGISVEALELAAAEVAGGGHSPIRSENGGAGVAQSSEESDEAVVRKAAKSSFRAHLFTYLAVIFFLGCMNSLTGGYPWFLWPAFGWGIGVALNARAALFPTHRELEHAVERRARRRARRARIQGGPGGVRVSEASPRERAEEEEEERDEASHGRRRR